MSETQPGAGGAAGETTCPLCNREGAGLAPCLGCDIRYHETCILELGCSTAGCGMLGVRGRCLWPQPSLPSKLARWAWMVSLAFLAAAGLREVGPRLVPDRVFGRAFLGVLIAASFLSAAAYVRDLATPYGRCLKLELQGRALMLIGLGMLLFAPLLLEGLPVVAAFALMVLGSLTDNWRPNRGTHHPIRQPTTRLVDILVVIAIIGVLAAIAVPNFKRPRSHSPTRACYANQKTVVGAVEMYNLDKNTKRERLDASFFQDLKSGGYLQSVPQDPSQGPGTSSHYYLVPSGNGIACEVHGAIQDTREAGRR